jgi:Ribosomal protein S6
MALYEHVFLARQDLSQAHVDQLAATATEIVENNEGKVTKTETWGPQESSPTRSTATASAFRNAHIEAPRRRVELDADRIMRSHRYMTSVDEHEMTQRDDARRGDAERPTQTY